MLQTIEFAEIFDKVNIILAKLRIIYISLQAKSRLYAVIEPWSSMFICIWLLLLKKFYGLCSSFQSYLRRCSLKNFHQLENIIVVFLNVSKNRLQGKIGIVDLQWSREVLLEDVSNGLFVRNINCIS